MTRARKIVFAVSGVYLTISALVFAVHYAWSDKVAAADVVVIYLAGAVSSAGALGIEWLMTSRRDA